MYFFKLLQIWNILTKYENWLIPFDKHFTIWYLYYSVLPCYIFFFKLADCRFGGLLFFITPWRHWLGCQIWFAVSSLDDPSNNFRFSNPASFSRSHWWLSLWMLPIDLLLFKEHLVSHSIPQKPHFVQSSTAIEKLRVHWWDLNLSPPKTSVPLAI